MADKTAATHETLALLSKRTADACSCIATDANTLAQLLFDAVSQDGEAKNAMLSAAAVLAGRVGALADAVLVAHEGGTPTRDTFGWLFNDDERAGEALGALHAGQ